MLIFMASVRRIGPLFWYQFPARALGIYRSPESSKAADAALRISKPEALLDGPMFHGPHCSGAHNVCFGLLDRKTQLAEPSELPRAGMTISVVNEEAYVTSGSTITPGADVAIQLYPALVRNRQNVASRSADPERTWRAALVLLDKETLAFAIGQRVSMHEFAEALVAAGARDAGYTDGGGSTSLWSRADATRYGSAENRAVPSWLVAHRVPSFPLVPVIAGVGALLAALTAWWFAGRVSNRRRKKRR